MILFRFNVILPRDIICYLRLIVDSLPISIRNSRFLFNLSKILFKIPEELYNFREKYKNGLIKDLSIYYLKDNENSLKRVSKTTDINSYHLSLIENLLQNSKSVNVLDLGCGTGFLINRIDKIFSSSKLVGIDFNAPSKESIKSNSRNNQIQFICGDIKSSLLNFSDNHFEIVLCTHVLEHLSNPKEILFQLRRVVKEKLIIICPLEKEYKWGMNYHVKFFPTKKHFINFLQTDFNNYSRFKTFQRLGDSMYFESYK